MLHRSLALLAIAWVSPLVAQQPVSPRIAPLDPAGTGGVRVVDRALAKLSNHQRLLIIGAHPDDEDTTLLALVGTGLGGEAAYLSLSRGEGGQNLIGPELGLGLGLIRTGELLAARRIEGTRQYFTRGYDFGYTRSLKETFERWPKEVLLEDAVRAVRRFKPQVIVAIFPGDGRAGHGQHQAAGVIAEAVFHNSGLPDRFPTLTDSGLLPWQPEALYRRVWRNRENATLEFALGRVDSLTGRSVLQLAGASRSMHRSQDMGTLQNLGQRRGGLIWVAGEASREADAVFGGVDTELAALADLTPEGPLRDQIRFQLEEIAALARQSRQGLSPVSLSGQVPALARIVRVLGELLNDIANSNDEVVRISLKDLLREKHQIASTALAAAAGVAVDAVAEQEAIVLGSSFPVTATLWNSGEEEVQVQKVEISCRQGWQTSSEGRIETEEDSGLQRWSFEVSALTGASPSVPYFLRQPLDGDLYDWKGVEEIDLGEPWGVAPVVAMFNLSIAGAEVRLEREVVYRQRSQIEGEVRRPLRAVPLVEISVEPDLLLWPQASSNQRQIEVVVRSHSLNPLRGRLELRSDVDWLGRPAQELDISEPNGTQVLRFPVGPPGDGHQGRVDVRAVAVLEGGQEMAASYPVISYPHIRRVSAPRKAEIEIQTLDLRLPSVDRIGYIRGASDRVPEILSEIGLPVEMLDATALGSGDLSVYDSIVVGSRAYETDPILAELNSRLIDYVRRGGLLVVQYQQYQFVRGGFAPIELEIDRPHGRVTDEAAPVEVLAPGHPVFRYPNRISEADWQDWVQERGLYFASRWDPSFTPLLSLQDEGREPERGALLMAEIGDGVYIYTGLSFFRQLPAGVPGAIRLFVNLLSRESS